MATKLATKLNLMISNECFQISSYFKNFKVRSQQLKNIACAIISLYVATMSTRNRMIDICAGSEWNYIAHPYEINVGQNISKKCGMSG